MAGKYILAIDQGTTNTKAILVDTEGNPVRIASVPMTSSYPRPGWAEQSAEAIWQSVRDVIARASADAGPDEIAGIAISNQRETLVLFDVQTGEPIAPAILWQCRRSSDLCAGLIDAGHDEKVVSATGLSINPLFPASKISWVLQNDAHARELAEAGRLRACTVDAWLCYKLTGESRFVTDHSNASRTQLFNINTLTWDADICALFGVDPSLLPTPLPSDSIFGTTAAGATVLPKGVPIRAVMGDSHAALFGHGVRKPGLVKATYGTGSSLMTLTTDRVTSRNGLSSTIAWTDRNATYYALEGNITVSAQAAAFMSALMGTDSVAVLSDFAESVNNSMGVVFVPALSGLGAPHWNDYATGTITGMTLGTTRAHLARATFEAIALQVCDVFTAMERDIGVDLLGILADGGASSNSFLMQLQSDLMNRTVSCSARAEVSALGVAYMALAGLGYRVGESQSHERVFKPRSDWDSERDSIRARWDQAIASLK